MKIGSKDLTKTAQIQQALESNWSLSDESYWGDFTYLALTKIFSQKLKC